MTLTMVSFAEIDVQRIANEIRIDVVQNDQTLAGIRPASAASSAAGPKADPPMPRTRTLG